MFFPAGRRHDEKHPWLFKANPTLQEWTKKLNNVRESKQADTSVISWFLCLVNALLANFFSSSKASFSTAWASLSWSSTSSVARADPVGHAYIILDIIYFVVGPN
ncbi:hypothetical protein P8452_00787 [Trifolium repens]|nr:hypothetical protein P8452_00787 [Trifolium repens]